MFRKMLCLAILFVSQIVSAQTSDYFNALYGEVLPGSTEQVGLWWASSGWKISRHKPLPKATSRAILIRAARNEAEAAQLIVWPTIGLRGLVIRAGALSGPGGAVIGAENIEVLKGAICQCHTADRQKFSARFLARPTAAVKRAD